MTIWSVIAPVIVVERSGVIDAFRRSRALVKGNGWQVFGVIFVVFLSTAVVSVVLAALAASTIYFSLLGINEPVDPASGAPSPASPA